MSVIFLIGFMGCGKSTLGRALERRAGVVFTDLDDEIERRAGMTVSEIFATRGEEEFRALERDTLRSLSLTDRAVPTVIACGGGTPCQPGNMELMDSLGTTVLLEAERERLVRRLIEGKAKRPLIAGLADADIPGFIDRKLAERAPYYNRAKSRFNSTLLENEREITATVNRFIQRFLSPLS